MAASPSTTEPSDELYLVAESNPTSTDITNKYVAYTDQTPETLLGAALYTNPSQETILQANDAPPMAKDIAFWKDQMFYANTLTKQRLTMTLISCGAPGLQLNDTIYISGVTYTAKAAENITNKEFQLFTAGTPAANIDNTAKSLIKVINRNTSNTDVYAYYLTGYDDLPGQILIEERGIGMSFFVATSSRGSAFSPPLPASGNDYASSNDTLGNRVYVSKIKQPESVPILNYFDVGSANDPIIRIVPLRYSMFIFKQEDGIFRVTGDSISNFNIDPFDTTTNIRGSETCVKFNNKIYTMSTQGVVTVSDAGVEIISRPIEKDLIHLTNHASFETYSYAIGYESKRKYILSTIKVDELMGYYEGCRTMYIYNYVTDTWTTWDVGTNHGIVFDNKLLISRPKTPTDLILEFPENRNKVGKWVGDIIGHYEYSYRYTIDSENVINYEYLSNYVRQTYSDNNIEVDPNWYSFPSYNFPSNNKAISVDTGLGTLDYYFAVIRVKDSDLSISEIYFISKIVNLLDDTTIEVEDVYPGYSFGGGWGYYNIILKPYSSSVKFIPIHSGNPGTIHHFRSVFTTWEHEDFNKITLTFYPTNVSGTTETVDVLPRKTSTDYDVIPTYVPREKARGNWLNLGLSMELPLDSFGLGGVSVYYEVVGPYQK